MKLLENRILRDAKVISEDRLSVEGFLCGLIDVGLVNEIANEFCKLFADYKATRLLTTALGSPSAAFTALKLDIPLLSAVRTGVASPADAFTGKVVSFTNSEVYDLSVSRDFLTKKDRILIISDFLSKGSETMGLVDIVRQSGAELCGVGVIIEKSYLSGAKLLRESGIHVESLAKIESMSRENGIRFVSE